MILKVDNIELKLVTAKLSNPVIKILLQDLNNKGTINLLESILKDIDCTRVYSCGSVINTIDISYSINILKYLYILNEIENGLQESTIYIYKQRLIERHNENIIFEKEHPINNTIVKTKRNKTKVAKYKTKDLFTNEDVYLLEDQKTKKHIVTKNKNLLDKKSVISINLMNFKFNK